MSANSLPNIYIIIIRLIFRDAATAVETTKTWQSNSPEIQKIWFDIAEREKQSINAFIKYVNFCLLGTPEDDIDFSEINNQRRVKLVFGWINKRAERFFDDMRVYQFLAENDIPFAKETMMFNFGITN